MKKTSIFDEYRSNIENIFSRIKKDNEFEIDFNMNKTGITYERYIDLMRYLTHVHTAKKLDLQKSVSLDIIYSEVEADVRLSYRISIYGRDLINKYLTLLGTKRGHVIFNVMMETIKEQRYPELIQIYKKTRTTENIYDLPEFNMRVRLSTEIPLSKSQINSFVPFDEKRIKNITFRLKQRLSLVLEKASGYKMQIDLTNAKTSQNFGRLESVPSNYELELEGLLLKDGEKISLNKLLDESIVLLKVLQQSNYIISHSESDKVLEQYKKIMGITKPSFNLDGRAPVSLEIQHATELLPNKYAVVDKADGDRHFMVICFGHVYLISQNLKIKDVGIQMKSHDFDDTIFDTEYVYLPKMRKHAILIFDCLFAKNVDVRKNPILLERLTKAQEIVNDCFVFDKQKNFKSAGLTGKNTIENMMKHYVVELDNYIKALIHDASIESLYPLIRVKYFMPVMGIADNEIFKYSMIMWNKYMYDENKYPYALDGMIYQPLNQEYITNVRESKLSDYKWKPQEKNTIDFYIRFEKDRTTGKIINVYDNSSDEYIKNKPYRICYLYNGKHTPEGEIPVYFNEAESLNTAYLFLDDGNVKDANGDIIQDDSVVEFSYNNNLEVNEKFRWIPLRTRYDKTEMVNRYKMKYGNSIDVAMKIWRSITVPVKVADLATLSDDAMYFEHRNTMRSKVTHELIISTTKENVYYQIKTRMAKPMRNFHNWMKSVLIFTYMNSDYNYRKGMTVLDVGSGRGGDLMKFYHAKIASGVCLEPDYENLHSPVDGAISRYNNDRKRYPAYPRLSFVNADFTIPLDTESQMKVVSDKSFGNKNLLDKLFPKQNMTQFDRINCQFAFHYFLANDKAWENTCQNINKCLKSGGYMVMTTLDAQKLMEAFGNNQKYTVYYTTDGEKKILMDFVKKFNGKQTSGLGLAVDVYNSLISNEDIYITEYMVDKDFIINELKEKCQMELVDTDLFERQFELNRENITKIANYDDNEETKSFLQSVATFYDQSNEFNAECYKITRLNRYYCFRKK